MNIFGFEIKRKKEEPASFTPEVKDDGATVVAAGGVYGQYFDMSGTARSEADLVIRYREMAEHPDVDLAIDEIVNESIIQEEERPTVQLNLDSLEMSDKFKSTIIDEFEEILRLLEFQDLSYDIFKRWYVDGRLYYHVIIDEKDPSKGIQELRYIDPRKIKKVRETEQRKNSSGLAITKTKGEYFIYNDMGFERKTLNQFTATDMSGVAGVKIAKDSILHSTSGLMNPNGDTVLSHLHKAIKPLNQLRSMEDSLIIYRISRAPERRIFYIDVGNLPKMKAEQQINDAMTRFKNKLVYDSRSGEIRDDRKFMTMMEDFFLPRQNGSRGTEITTLPGGQSLGILDDILYFQKNLYRALNVPVSRIENETPFNIGRSQEISREEIKFAKFVTRLRAKFSQIFVRALEKQLILKQVVTYDEWETIKDKIRFKFSTDSYYSELKETEILRDRIAMLRDINDFAGIYYSHDTIRRIVLKQTDEDIQKENDKIIEERSDPIYSQLNQEDPAQSAPQNQ